MKKAAALPKDNDAQKVAKGMKAHTFPQAHTSKSTGGMKNGRTCYQACGPKHANEKHC